jgi:hypothetical protein
VPAPRYGIQAKQSTNHLRELRQNIKILKILAPENYQDKNHHWRDEILRTVPIQEKIFLTLSTLDAIVDFLLLL